MQLNQHACCGRRVEGLKGCAHHQQGCRCCTLVCMQSEGAGFCSRHVGRSSLYAQSTRPGRRPLHKRCQSPRGGSTPPSSIATSSGPRQPGPILSLANADGCPWMQLCILILNASCTCQAATASQRGWLHAAQGLCSDLPVLKVARGG